MAVHANEVINYFYAAVISVYGIMPAQTPSFDISTLQMLPLLI